MKLNILILILLYAACTVSAQSAARNNSWKNALKPKGITGNEITLAEKGKSIYAIIIPDNPSTQELKAAADLGKWLEAIIDSVFSIYKESDIDAPETDFISIGRTIRLAMSGSDIASADLADEGYAIDQVDGNLFLAGGRTRGIINAVYALLEEDLGCRWYSRFSQSIPSKRTLRFTPVKRSYIPVLEIRDPYYWEAFEGEWSLRNKTNSSVAAVPNAWGGNMHYAMFVHTFGALLPPAEYFEKHPEYFSEHNGKRDASQICVSNPDVAKIVAENVKRILRESPNARIISVSQNDGPPCCACDKCKAVADAEGSIAGPLLNFVNAVADDVGKAFPNVKISTLAYMDTFMPPKTIKPRDNVAIQLCTDSHAWPEPFLMIEETEKFQTAMKAWAALGANIHIWDYTCNFSHYLGLMPNWQVVSNSIDFFVKNNAKGIMLQGNYQTPGTADGYMRCWVWGKLLWNPKLDTRSLMKDFVFGYYGKAAKPIWEYQELLWDTWNNEHNKILKTPPAGIRYPMSLFSEEFMIKARECFERAEKLTDDAETKQRVEESELQILYADISRAAEKGNPPDIEAFRTNLDKFERIARRMNVTHLREGPPDFEQWIAQMRGLIK